MYPVVYISCTYIHKLDATRFWLSFYDETIPVILSISEVMYYLGCVEKKLYPILREINSICFNNVSHPISFSGKCPFNLKDFNISITLVGSPT